MSFPASPNWNFYGPANGGPSDVRDAAMDEGGNLWVAGGAEGLFLMRADPAGTLSGRFEKFGIADGLHPYGWLNGEAAKAAGVPDGSPADRHPDLAATPVISVAGGPAATVFVGYQGKRGCEDAWHGDPWTPATQWGDPSVYKSGDADRVTLTAAGISVVHYDIFSGPGVVGAEIKGREKICTVFRIVWDKAKDKVWFGGNHGFAVGVADAQGAPTCNGEYPGATNPGTCAVVWEHSHPAISGCASDEAGSGCTQPVWLTDSYSGMAIDPTTHDAWAGGANRTTKYHLGSYGGDLGAYYMAEDDTEWPAGRKCPHALNCGIANRFDLWPDQVPEWTAIAGVIYVKPSQRVDDLVSGIAALADGTAWVGSFAHGLVHIDSSGTLLDDATRSLTTPYVSALALDARDNGTVWAGMNWGGGISRVSVNGKSFANYGSETFGSVAADAPVASVQSHGAGVSRRMLVGFRAHDEPVRLNGQVVGKTSYAGAVGVYRGN